VLGWLRRGWESSRQPSSRDLHNPTNQLGVAPTNQHHKPNPACPLPNPPNQVRAVLDWELCTLGNPWADVAYTCLAYHMPPQLPSLRLATPLPAGVPDESTLLARYCAVRGVSPPPPREWAFYLSLSLFRLLSILAGVQARARQGNASSAAAAAISSDAVLSALTDAALAIVDRAEAGGSSGSRRAPHTTSNAASSSDGAPPSLGAPSAHAADLLRRVRDFMAAHVLPAEDTLTAHARGDSRWTIHPLMEELKGRARAQGLWNLWLPADTAARLTHLLDKVPAAERGTLLGAGLSNLDYAHVCCAMGRSVWAPEVFNCSAPDTGNMEVLARYGTPEQQQRWLVPLLRGEIRSCFAMTEKAVASSDATNITASITPGDDGAGAGGCYTLNGVKWWTSGAMDPRCEVAVFMGKTDTSAPAHLQQSMILVPMSAPGVKVVRPLLGEGLCGVAARNGCVVLLHCAAPVCSACREALHVHTVSLLYLPQSHHSLRLLPPTPLTQCMDLMTPPTATLRSTSPTSRCPGATCCWERGAALTLRRWVGGGGAVSALGCGVMGGTWQGRKTTRHDQLTLFKTCPPPPTHTHKRTQGRLGPGRLHHCMRLIGAGERGIELMAQRALSRVAFGRPLAAQGGLQEKLARCRVSLEGARLLVLSAAHALDA